MTTKNEQFTSERLLVEALIENDPTAWKVFVDRYQPFVLGVARKALLQSGQRNPESLAGDVANEVFAEMLADDRKALKRFREPWSFKGWLSIVASRRARRMLRRQRRDEGQELPEVGVSAGGRSPASEIGRIEDMENVRRRLEELKPRDRLALQLFYEGNSYKDVASMLDLPVSRVGTILARARERLARLLERAS